MTEMYSLYIRLRGLVIFRRLLEDAVLSNLLEFLKAESLEQKISYYAAFVAALYEKGNNLSDYLLKLVICEENIYIKNVALKKAVSPELEECLAKELLLFEEISRLTPRALREAIKYAGFLPSYVCAEHDFRAAYAERLSQINCVGYGVFADNFAFRLKSDALVPVRHPDPVTLARLPGYERERRPVIDNTLALIKGRPAANVLLYGDGGTGKSSTVKALLNEYAHLGLRLIEVRKDCITQVPALLDSLADNPLRFIIFIDDLSFTKADDNFAALKAILEGSVSYKNNNVAIYATSNRRHLVKESFSDREGDEIHLGDTIAELTSLSDRFGITATFTRPDRQQYIDIVKRLALLNSIDMPQETLIKKAEAYALRRGGRSPRVAKQFIEAILAN